MEKSLNSSSRLEEKKFRSPKGIGLTVVYAAQSLQRYAHSMLSTYRNLPALNSGLRPLVSFFEIEDRHSTKILVEI